MENPAKPFQVSVLSIGDELLIGQVINSNAAHIGRELSAIGAGVRLQFTVADQAARIHEGLRLCLEQTDVVLITGGLGPTQDDITVQAIASFTDDSLVRDEYWVTQMEKLFAARGRVMTENNLKQALLPSRATRIDNDCGSAPGIFLEPAPGKMLFLMPGVPHEMKSMLKRFVIPKIEAILPGNMLKSFQRTIFTTGIGESLLAAKVDELRPSLQDTLKTYGNNVKLAWVPTPLGVKLRITALAQSEKTAHVILNEIQSILLKAAASYVYGKSETFDEILLEDVVGQILKKQNLTIATAESCTGGLIASRLTDIAGASEYLLGGVIAYSNALKISQLKVGPETLNVHGAVSEQTVREMCEGVRQTTGAAVGVAVSGILGPGGGSPDKPVGTVWIAVSAANKQTIVKKYLFENDRLRNKERTVQAALDQVRRTLENP